MNKWQGTGNSVEEAVEIGLKEMGASLGEIEIKVLATPNNGIFGLFKKPAKVSLTRINPLEGEIEETRKIVSKDPLNTTSGAEEKTSTVPEVEKTGEMSKEVTSEKETSVRVRRDFVKGKDLPTEARETAIRFIEEVAYQMGAEDIQITSENKEEGLFIAVEGDKNGILIGKHGKTLEALQYLTGLAVQKVVEGRVRVIVDVEGYRERRKATLEGLAVRYANQAVERGSKVVLEPMNPQERRLIHMILQEDSRIETASEGEEPYRRLVIIPKELTNGYVIHIEKIQRRNADRDNQRSGYNRRK